MKDTNALLDQYIGMLDRSEAVTKLILDERWQGASAVCPVPLTIRYPLKLTGRDLKKDEEILMNQIREREDAKRQEAEAREREAELARQRLEQERLAREEEERRQVEREKALEKKKGVGRGIPRTGGDSSSSGVKGVRGTRATMRARGVATGIARGRIASFPTPEVVLMRSNVNSRYHHHHFGSWKDQYPPTFVLGIDSDEYDPVTRSRPYLIQPAGIQ